MPSTKKRVNMTLPDPVYERLQAFKEKNGITNDASACLQLVIKQLKAEENMELLLQSLRGMTVEDAKKMSADGIALLKDCADTQE